MSRSYISFLLIASILTTVYASTNPTYTVSTLISGLSYPSALSFSPPNSYSQLAYILTNYQIITVLVNGGNTSVLAGNGLAGFVDDTGLSAQFNGLNAVVIHPLTGTLFMTDLNNHRIRACTAQGVVTTIAGNGIHGNVDGAGFEARFFAPVGIVMDSTSTSLYVSCYFGNRLRKVVLATGSVSTLAGSGVAAEINGIGLAASFHGPVGLAWSITGDLLVADSGGSRIRIVTVPGAMVTTLAYITSSEQLNPFSLATYAGGNVMVAETSHNRIRRIDWQTRQVTTVSGSGVGVENDGIGITAGFRSPLGLTILNDSLYVADLGGGTVRKIVISCPIIGNVLHGGSLCDASCAAAGLYSTGSNICSLCPLGSYCPKYSTTPLLCPAGMYGDSISMSTDLCSGQCPIGNFCPVGSRSPTPCPAGQYGSVGALKTAACSGLCSTGYYCPAGSTSSTAVACPSGLICPAGSGAPPPTDSSPTVVIVVVVLVVLSVAAVGGALAYHIHRSKQTHAVPDFIELDGSDEMEEFSATNWQTIGANNPGAIMQ